MRGKPEKANEEHTTRRAETLREETSRPARCAGRPAAHTGGAGALTVTLTVTLTGRLTGALTGALTGRLTGTLTVTLTCRQYARTSRQGARCQRTLLYRARHPCRQDGAADALSSGQ